MKEIQIEESENLDLLKIELNYLANKEYKWELYSTSKEAKEFFKKLYRALKDDKTAIDLGFKETFKNFKEYKEELILDSIPQIKEEFEKLL